MANDDALIHIERLLADTYRREIEQEENIWRSLPFFAATLALELAALFQVIDRLPPLDTWAGRISVALLAAAALSSFLALGFLASTILPAKLRYIATDEKLFDYALRLVSEENDPAIGSSPDPIVAVQVLRATLAEQYAGATDYNRRINRRRERRRSIAGLATIAAILSTLLLVGTTFAHYVVVHAIEGTARGRL